MANLNNFNANEVESTNDFDPIPAGKYAAMITASQMKDAKNGTGSYLELTFQILEGEYQNRLLWARLCLTHTKEVTSKIARGHLSAICKAVGVLTPHDSAELHNLPLILNVKLKKRTDNGELTNDLRGFSKRESVAAPVGQTKPSYAPWKK
jgi:hypothetical protein